MENDKNQETKIRSAIFTEVNQLLKKANLSTQERLDLYAISGQMADEDTPSEDFLLMYLSGDRDWKADFKKMYGREAGKLAKREKKKFDITKVTRAVVKKKK
jgi:hypothetical protein